MTSVSSGPRPFTGSGSRGLPDPPSVRTIGLILERRRALDRRSRRRTRRPPPPPGWYLPPVADGRAELDSFDLVEGLVIRGGIHVEVLNGISLHGGLVVSWPHTAITADFVVGTLVEHWRAAGLPGYAQFDNDPIFEGPQIHPDTIGRVTRACLSLGVVPVFVPPRETGFQAAIEGFNGLWQAKVWARFQHPSLEALQAQSVRYVAGHRQRAAARIEAAPGVRPSREGGAWTCKPTRKGDWCSCGVATGKGKCSCWAGPSPWIRCGSIAWSVLMLILKGVVFASPPCTAALRRRPNGQGDPLPAAASTIQ